MLAEGISKGDADAKNIVGMKFVIVDDVVPMRLRTNEEISPEGVLHANAEVQKEMVAVEGSTAASGGNVASVGLVVEEQ